MRCAEKRMKWCVIAEECDLDCGFLFIVAKIYLSLMTNVFDATRTAVQLNVTILLFLSTQVHRYSSERILREFHFIAFLFVPRAVGGQAGGRCNTKSLINRFYLDARHRENDISMGKVRK